MKLDFESFAETLVSSGDLDPDYIFIKKTALALGFSREQLCEWVLLKSVVYRSASELEFLLEGVPIDELRFGSERQKSKRRAAKDWETIRGICSGKGGFSSFFSEVPKNARDALEFFKRTLPNTGPWAAWKLADLSERVLDSRIDFSRIDFRNAYEYPLRGIAMLAGLEESETKNFRSNAQLYERALETALKKMGRSARLFAPPDRDRPLNAQEFETLFCKFHSHVHGHYEPLEDLRKLRAAVRASKFQGVRDLARFCP